MKCEKQIKSIAVIKELIWHVTKVSNILLYDIKNVNEKIDIKLNLNILTSKIYNEYRENNWHSKFLHSHMLQEAIIGIISSYKSYYKLNEMYNKNKLLLKGKPNIYEKECKILNKENKNIMAIDLGLNNIVACKNKDNASTLLVSGKMLKCKNKYINMEIAT